MIAVAATRREASPPNPLNRATNSGIEVILIFIANPTPINEPRRNPATMSS